MIMKDYANKLRRLNEFLIILAISSFIIWIISRGNYRVTVGDSAKTDLVIDEGELSYQSNDSISYDAVYVKPRLTTTLKTEFGSILIYSVGESSLIVTLDHKGVVVGTELLN